MNNKNTEKLYHDFSDLYRGRAKSPRESLMCFGFECGNGWFNIINELSKAITEYAKAKHLDVEVSQVKEKFASLRFYIDDGDDYIQSLIEQAERKSTVTCEDCGQPGQLRSRRGWFATLCDLCAFEKNYDTPPDMNSEDEAEPVINPIGDYFRCAECESIHFENIQPQYRNYGWRCSRCGLTGKDKFVLVDRVDLPNGGTIPQVNTENLG